MYLKGDEVDEIERFEYLRSIYSITGGDAGDPVKWKFNTKIADL